MLSLTVISSILQEVTNKILKDYKLKGPYNINNGYCEEWANEVIKRIPEAEDVGTPEKEWDEENWATGHVWIVINGINYDAETMEGVKDWKNLTPFKNNRLSRAERKHLYHLNSL